MKGIVDRFFDLQSRLQNLKERAAEHDELVRAIRAGEVEGLVVLQKDGASVYPVRSDENLYRTIVEDLPQAVCTVLGDGTFVYANRAMSAIIGDLHDEVVGQNLLDHVPEDEKGRVSAMLRNALLEQQEIELTLYGKQAEKAVLLSARRLDVAGADAIAIVAVDLSDQIARRVAEEASGAKDDLIAAVSHELRTPLTSMLGWVQLLEFQFQEDERVTHDLQNLKNAIQAQVRIVSDLLELAQTQKGTFRIVPRPFDLRSAVNLAIDFISLQARNKQLKLQLDIAEDALPVHGDVDRLGQVMLNLLSNAVKFTDTGGEVRVRVRKEEGHAHIVVEDTGAGIAPDFVPFVFEPFRRSDAARNSKPGLGIGLAIARRIVEAHGGVVRAESEGSGKGATFYVEIPLSQS